MTLVPKLRLGMPLSPQLRCPGNASTHAQRPAAETEFRPQGRAETEFGHEEKKGAWIVPRSPEAAISRRSVLSAALPSAAKSAGVLMMLALSALVWRRGLAVGRIEAAVAVVVVAATALLAAYPLPPARVADAAAIRDTAATGDNPARP